MRTKYRNQPLGTSTGSVVSTSIRTLPCQGLEPFLIRVLELLLAGDAPRLDLTDEEALVRMKRPRASETPVAATEQSR